VSYETIVERDRDVLSGEEVARIRYRRNGERCWSSFVVVLDEDTTFETVEANSEQIVIAAKSYERRS
jgi:hypothetical protein